MKKQTVEFAVVTKNGVVTQIGRSVIYQPEIKFKGGTVKWVDDSKYMKKHHQEGYVYNMIETVRIYSSNSGY